MIDDLRLLAEFDEIKGTPVHDYLKELQKGAVIRVKTASTDRMANVATGEMTVLDSLLEIIESSHDWLAKLHEEARMGKQDVSQGF